MEKGEKMSVTFFDADNPAQLNSDGDQVGGGIEVNFSNANAAFVLELMGVYEEDAFLIGEMSGEEFRKNIVRGLANIEILMTLNSSFNKAHLTVVKSRLERLQTVFVDTVLVRWE